MDEAAKRVPRLVDAVLSVTSDLELPVVLRQVVEAAHTLVGARYAALGVLGEDAWLREFIHTGMDDEQVERIGQLPVGRGVLGLLIREPRPLRLRDLREHPGAHGFPEGHPAMTSFLGAPIRVDGVVFGNLYLTDKQEAEEFSDEDEELVVALAAVAGAAIHNAHLHEAMAQRERWLDAARGVTAALLDHQGLDDILEQIAWHARDLAGADLATVVLPVDEDTLHVRIAVGDYAPVVREATFPRRNSISGDLLETGQAVVLDDVAADQRTSQPLVLAGRFGPAMFVALQSRGQRFGTLMTANRRDGRRFTSADAALVGSLADQASMAVSYHRAQDDIQRLLIVEERERIGRDLRESVITRLSSTGWAIEQTATRLDGADPELSRRLMALVDDLDTSMRDIRSMVFGHAPKPDARGGHEPPAPWPSGTPARPPGGQGEASG